MGCLQKRYKIFYDPGFEYTGRKPKLRAEPVGSRRKREHPAEGAIMIISACNKKAALRKAKVLKEANIIGI